MSDDSDQYMEFMTELKYATKLVRTKKFNLGQYYDHMAGYFDHIKRPEDAEEHRVLAKKWEIEKGEKHDN